MSEASKKSSKKKKPKVSDRKLKAARAATKLPDDEAIRKLFPKKVVDELNKIADHKPKS